MNVVSISYQRIEGNGMKAYLAAPIVGISDEQRQRIDGVRKRLTDTGIDVSIPGERKVPNAWGMTQDEWSRCVFANDVVTIDSVKWVVVCDFGRHLTSGTAWECGYAFGTGKKVLLIHMGADDYSLMLRGCSTNYCSYGEFMGADDVMTLFVERGKTSRPDVTLN